MRKGLAIGLLSLVVSQAQSLTTPAEKVAWLKANGVPLRSIDPHGRDFSDLQPIARAIGDARVVMLGGTNAAPIVGAKDRLIRFLHQDMGFDVLVSEASFFDAEEVDLAWDARGTPDTEALHRTESVFTPRRMRIQPPVLPLLDPDPLPEGRPDRLPPPRSHVGGVMPVPAKPELPKYLLATHHTQRPFHLAGTGTARQRLSFAPASRKHLADQLFAAIDRAAPHAATAADRKIIGSLLAMVNLRSADPAWQHTDAEWRTIEQTFDRLIDTLGRVSADSPDASQAALAKYTLARLRYECLSMAQIPKAAKPEPPLDIVVWIAKFWRPDSKVVVWSRNDLIGRDTAVAKELGAKIYSVAFDEIDHESEVPLVLEAGPIPSLRPIGSDLEGFLHAVDQRYLFVDFRSLPNDHWLRGPIAARILYGSAAWANDQVHITPSMTVSWSERYDGIISIDTVATKGRTKQ